MVVFVSLAVLGAVMLSGCVDDKAPSETAMVKLVNCKGQGSMPQTSALVSSMR